MAKRGHVKGKKTNKQRELKDAIESVPGDTMNQNHNAMKEALGPNARR